jgi:type IV pilus assembly protein PilA
MHRSAMVAAVNKNISRAGDSTMKRATKARGFTLLELLVVLIIVLIISALAVANLMRSKIAANEASAASSLRVLNSACANYSVTWAVGYPLTLNYLGPGNPPTATAADLIDSLLAAGTKAGYNISYISAPPSGGQVRSYTLSASPVIPGLTGSRYFFTDQTGIIRQNSGAPATVASTPLN